MLGKIKRQEKATATATATAKSKAKEFGLMLWLYSQPLILLFPNMSEDE